MLLTKEVEVKVTKANLEYFLAKGYNCNIKDKIMVNPFDLGNQSEKEILYKCDCCGKEIKLHWCDYLKKRNREYSEAGDFCNDCAKKKRAEWFKINKEQAYKDIYIKARNKAKETCLQKYGCENVMQNNEIKEKLKESIQKKYGVDNVMELPEIREKIAKTLGINQELEAFVSENGKIYYKYKGIPCSQNQLHLHELLGGELNGFISYYPVDLLFSEDKIYLEYNGTGHNLSVKMKKKTEKQQKQDENKRYFYLKNQGYKQILFVSLTKRKLPSDEIILSLISQAKKYLNNNHNWIEFNLDENCIRWKENSTNYDFNSPIQINF